MRLSSEPGRGSTFILELPKELMLVLLTAAVAIPLGLDLYMPVPEDNPSPSALFFGGIKGAQPAAYAPAI